MQKKNRIKHTKLLCLAGALLTACFLCGCTKKEELLFLTEEGADETAVAENVETAAENAEAGEEALSLQEAAAESGLIYVHICGAVEAAGVYELPAGSRVYEAVQAAGGFAEDAEKNYVNQAQILTDGAKLMIPTVEEAAAAEDEEAFGEENAKKTGGRININTATKQELCGIPGVGETRAAAIISYRESHGSFAKPEDIMKVSGIKEGMYDRMKESICVN